MAKNRDFMGGKKKRCRQCGDSKPYISFNNKLRKDGSRYFSPVCRRCSFIAWKIRHPEDVKAKQRRYDTKVRETLYPKKRQELFDHIGQHSCKRCGIDDERVLHFHHRNRKEKSFPLSALNLSIDRLKAEAKKCDVYCANCHIILHCEEKKNGKKPS
ncbi:MAG: hypothetical protein MOB07_31050 [Acidobacteria bacterium]|nr:hypothetical protein [Acidobacteriota bacterium]